MCGFTEIFPAPDGKRYRNVSNVFWSETLISSNVDDNKMERILYLFDYLLSEEGYALIRYGLEGVDYIIQDGKYHCLLEDISEGSLVKTLENKYPSLTLFPSLASWGGDRTDFEPNEINYLRYGKYATDISYQSLLWNEENTIPVERNFDCLLMPKEPSDMFSTQAVLDDLTRIIIGKGDPIQMWESQLERYYQEGIADYIQRHNEAYLKTNTRGDIYMHGVFITDGVTDWQIVQHTNGYANLSFSGTWQVPKAAVEIGVKSAVPLIRVVHQDDNSQIIPWTEANISHGDNPCHGTWNAEIQVPAGGLYRIETGLYTKSINPDLRWTFRGDVRVHIGVGDIFVIAGQSNSSGYGRDWAFDPPMPGVHLYRNRKKWDLACHPINESTFAADEVNAELGVSGVSPTYPLASILLSYLTIP